MRYFLKLHCRRLRQDMRALQQPHHPINTVATSFVTKLCGKPTWDGLSSNQVFAGWIFDVPYWETVKMIEIKEKKAQELLGINGKWA